MWLILVSCIAALIFTFSFSENNANNLFSGKNFKQTMYRQAYTNLFSYTNHAGNYGCRNNYLEGEFDNNDILRSISYQWATSGDYKSFGFITERDKKAIMKNWISYNFTYIVVTGFNSFDNVDLHQKTVTEQDNDLILDEWANYYADIMNLNATNFNGPMVFKNKGDCNLITMNPQFLKMGWGQTIDDTASSYCRDYLSTDFQNTKYLIFNYYKSHVSGTNMNGETYNYPPCT